MKTIPEWQEHVHRIAESKGWWDDIETWGQPNATEINSRLMLIVSEVAEACEELRDGRPLAEIRRRFGDDKPEGFAIECADAVIRIMDLCGALGIDLQEAMQVKSAYNETRPHRHGGKAL